MGALVLKRSQLAVVCETAVSNFFGLENAKVEVYRRLKGVAGEVVEPCNIYSDGIG